MAKAQVNEAFQRLEVSIALLNGSLFLQEKKCVDIKEHVLSLNSWSSRNGRTISPRRDYLQCLHVSKIPYMVMSPKACYILKIKPTLAILAPPNSSQFFSQLIYCNSALHTSYSFQLDTLVILTTIFGTLRNFFNSF